MIVLQGLTKAIQDQLRYPGISPSFIVRQFKTAALDKSSFTEIENRRRQIMSNQEVQLNPDFRERAKANDVPVGASDRI